MPEPIETSDRHQPAVVIQANGYGANGEPLGDDPFEIMVRWESGRRDAVDPLGRPIALDAMVVVDRVIPINSSMWLGTLDDFNAITGEIPGLMYVRTFSEIPDVENRERRRVAGLSRDKGEIPGLTIGTGT